MPKTAYLYWMQKYGISKMYGFYWATLYSLWSRHGIDLQIYGHNPACDSFFKLTYGELYDWLIDNDNIWCNLKSYVIKLITQLKITQQIH